MKLLQRKTVKIAAYGKMGFTGMMLLAAFLLWLSPAYAGTIYEKFDNNTYNQKMFWIGSQGLGPTTAVANNRLEITIPANASAGGNPYPFGGSIGSKFTLVGDFDVQVDFNLFNWPAPVGIQVGIGPLGGGFQPECG